MSLDHTPASGAVSAVLPPTKPKSRFALTAFAEDFDKPIAAHLIRNLLPSTGLAVVSGKEKSGKTFLALSMVLAVASGERFWQGLPDRKIREASRDGIVIYISAEGSSGFRMRKKAHALSKGWKEDELKNIRFYDIQAAPNLRNAQDLLELVESVKQPQKPINAIVIDTVARTLYGNENDGSDMSEYIASCDHLAKVCNTLVILVHHMGKDTEKGMRGHSVLPAAVDVEIKVQRVDDIRSASIQTAKDIPEAIDFFHFKLKPVAVGKDEDGGDVVSCHLLQCETPNKSAPAPVKTQKDSYAEASRGGISNVVKNW